MTYADIMNQFDSLLTKQAFVPAPQSSAGKQLMQQQQQGQPGQQPPGPDAGGGGGQEHGECRKAMETWK